MANKNGMEFWTFSSGDPELLRFCAARADDTSLYCILYVEEYKGNHTAEVRELLHLRSGSMLFLDAFLIPIYARLPLTGSFIIFSKAFCATDQTKALFKFFFFHQTPEGMTDSGNATDDQKKCIALICEEYGSAYDDLQPHLLRNLLRNLPLLSDTTYTAQLEAGHLLGYAMQFMDLVEAYAFQEKRKSFYADKMGITEKSLTRVLQSVFRTTFRDMLVYQTLIEAMKQLVFSSKSITQIAHELNYDASDFNKLFVKWKGMLPKDLRVRYREIVNQIENGYY